MKHSDKIDALLALTGAAFIAFGIVVMVIALTGCVHLEPRMPQLRDASAQQRAAVVITSDCADGFSPNRVASGIVISERHVLTAAHVVRCWAIPTVRAYFGELDYRHGRRLAVVEEDLENDVALLEVADAGNFERGFAPPVVDWVNDNFGCAVTAYPERGARCGELSRTYWTYAGGARWKPTLDAPSAKGNSGAGVYGAGGALLGIVTGGNESKTTFSRVTPEWLRGVKK